ncbi:type IV secretion system protein VirB10 [Pseudomonas sp. Marseille-Q5115]|uniref:type IV secretion system protein VirB10 n=1 Tax=Pseudomonas sp. Marseille-Q5115 TaxID=2866593 RepID=UPI001CE4A47A|nr:type IV secretion system protein VirB10 [Pseudomonas sp. Marseille-Q5115]
MAREPVDIDSLDTEFDERGKFAGGGKKSIPGLRVFIVAMLCILLGLLAWTLVSAKLATQKPETEEAKPKQSEIGNALPPREFSQNSPDAGKAAEPSPVVNTLPQRPVAAERPAPAGSKGKPELTPEQKAMARRLGKEAGGTSDSSPSEPENQRRGQDLATSEGSSKLASALKPAKISGSKAGRLANPSLTISRGTMISCGTKTQLDTTVPGMVSCQVSRDVYSADGKVKLINKGAHVDGEVSGGISQGQAAVFALWTRVRNKDQVIADLASPGTSRLGASGIPGQVDDHFWERFKGAIFVSILSDMGDTLTQLAANSANSGDGNTSVSLGNTENSGDSLAREALRNSIDIPPTLTVNQGEGVSIYVARDVDFSDVYSLEMSR